MRKEVIEASVVAGLKIAFADGVLQAHERERLIQKMREHISGNIIAQGQFTKYMEQYLEAYRHHGVNIAQATDVCLSQSFSNEEKDVILRVCIAVGLSKKVMSYVEKRACCEVALRLNMDPKTYDLE
jgi:tellurite resistance protein